MTTHTAEIDTSLLDQVHLTASVTNEALYVGKAGYSSNAKIAPAELLLLAVKQTLYCVSKWSAYI